MSQENQGKYAIRFGLGAIKAVGLSAMEKAAEERKENGEFADIYDFAKRMDAKSVNKKSVEALSKSGAFDSIANNRRQIFESFNVISAYAAQQEQEANSNQMSFLGDLIDESKSKPELKKTEQWDKTERLQKEFEAFGFYLTEHPVDDHLEGLRRRGVVFCDKIEKDEFDDGDTVKMAGAIASSKHRSSAKGRFAYVNISDPYGIFEAMIFDEELITKSRDLLEDGSVIALECYIRKDEGGIRIMIKSVQALEDFIASVTEEDEPFEDIKKRSKRRYKGGGESGGKKWDGNKSGGQKWSSGGGSSGGFKAKPKTEQQPQQSKAERLASKEILPQVTIKISNRDAIFNVKSFLSRRVAPEGFEKTTKVMLNVGGTKVELPQKYILEGTDVQRMRGISGVGGVN